MQSKLMMLVATVLVLVGSHSGFAYDQVERIDATAYGTSTQLGHMVHVQLAIDHYSSPEDRQILVDAFNKGKSSGLAQALSKMKGVGRVSVPGSTGYQIKYATQVQTPTGRKIRFITNRWILFGETYHNTRSKDYNLTAGEINLDTQQKDKSAGVLAPAAKLAMNKNGELEFDLFQNPWRLSNIIDWTKDTEK
jgi:hypothetical protein